MTTSPSLTEPGSDPSPPTLEPAAPLTVRSPASGAEALTTLSPGQRTLRALLGDPQVYRSLRQHARRRVPAQDLEDLVHDSVVSALEAPSPPAGVADCRRWLQAIVRNGGRDRHRHQQVEQEIFVAEQPSPACGGDEAQPASERPEAAAAPAPLSQRERLSWVQQKLEAGELSASLLEQMVRQSEGEELTYADEQGEVPPVVLRQRLRRQRRRLRAAWDRESAVPSSRRLEAARAAADPGRPWRGERKVDPGPPPRR